MTTTTKLHLQVRRIRPDSSDPDRRIDLFEIEGQSTLIPIDTLIRWMVEGHRFYVLDGTSWIYLERRQHPVSGRWYVRTIPDGRYDNNLYALPRC